MSFPNYPDKYQARTFVTAKNFWKYKKNIGSIPKEDPPKGVIICYSPSLMKYIIESHSVLKVDNVFGDYFYLLEDSNKKIGICGGFGIGAPIVAILLEELTVYGVKLFLSIGTAGAIQNNLKLGSYVICDKAIRDEGTSHHYFKAEKYSYPSKRVTEKMLEVIQDLDLEFTVGTTWTIDAPYRETCEEIMKYRKEDVLTVEMEAAAIFAVAKYLNVETGALLTISDYLCEEEWQLHFHLTEEHLKTLFKIAKKTINSL